MNYLIAKDFEDALRLRAQYRDYDLLHGGSDLVLKLKKSGSEGIIDLSHLKELKTIERHKDFVRIGALCSISEILQNDMIGEEFPLLVAVSKHFASHQIRNIATLAGNIANDSPVADLITPLLVLQSRVELSAVGKKRTLLLEDLFVGFKTLDLHDEMISAFEIPRAKRQWYYKKVGSRARLNISKLSIAVVKKDQKFFVCGSSLNPYVKRFFHVEKLLDTGLFDETRLEEALKKDIRPSGSFRSTQSYRYKVAMNLIQDALEKFGL